MRKNLHRWLAPLLFAVIIVVFMWAITDIASSNVYFWNITHEVWKITHETLAGRLLALTTAIAIAYFIHFAFNKTVHYFIQKNNKKMPAKEYLFVLALTVICITPAVLFIFYFINHKFSWADLMLVYGLGIPLNFSIYVTKRNNRITDAFNRQTLLLEKTRSNQLETELKYLRAQYHPHFLFNALNTIYFRINEENTDAKNTVELLSKLLRYQLYNIDEKVKISEEINFIKTYIQFQQLRMTKRLEMNTYFDEFLDKQKIYPLIYQPFLENAFKYVGGEYRIHLEMKYLDSKIIFHLENSLPEETQPAKKSGAGIGIENSRRRLALLYPDQHQLNINQEEKLFEVELIIMDDG